MNIVISLPDELLQAADEYAQARGMSRSQLCAQAIAFYLHARRYDGVTDALNRVYGAEPALRDPWLAAAQSRLFCDETW